MPRERDVRQEDWRHRRLCAKFICILQRLPSTSKCSGAITLTGRASKTKLMLGFQQLLSLINYSCSPLYQGLETKPTDVFQRISNTDANSLNLHINKARKTHDDKKLYLITFYQTYFKPINYLLLTLHSKVQLF